jgi:hypothetical protein
MLHYSTKTPFGGAFRMSKQNPKTEHDIMPQIKRIVRDAIKDGLIRSVSLKDFDHKMKTLKGNDLENYIQKLWDEL